MSDSVIVLGAGGHASVVIDALQQCESFSICGVTAEDYLQKGQHYLGVRVLGSDDVLPEYPADQYQLINGVGLVRPHDRHVSIYHEYSDLGYRFPSFQHPSATVSTYAELSDGVQVMAGAVIQAGAKVGANVIINTRASIDHDNIIAAHSHIAPGVVLAGNVMIGSNTLIGAGSTVLPGVTIGSDCIVAAGSVVTRDVFDGEMVVGVPARRKQYA